jgi:hypothetical protein
VAGHRPAHDVLAPGVDHHGEVEEARGGRHEGDVTYSELVGGLGREVAVHEIGRGASLPVASSGHDASAPAADADKGRLAQLAAQCACVRVLRPALPA